MKTETKEEKLFRLLKKQWVTPRTALEKCGLFTLAQRVSEWRAAGVAIKDEWVKTPGARFKRYRRLA